MCLPSIFVWTSFTCFVTPLSSAEATYKFFEGFLHFLFFRVYHIVNVIGNGGCGKKKCCLVVWLSDFVRWTIRTLNKYAYLFLYTYIIYIYKNLCNIWKNKLDILATKSFMCIHNHQPVQIYNLCFRQTDAVPFCETYAKLYFDAKHLEKVLNRRWWSFWCLFFRKKCPFLSISDAALIC